MNQKQLHKSFVLFLLACSFCSFLFVNIHAAVFAPEQATTSLPKTTIQKQQKCAEEDDEAVENKIDAMFLARVVEVASRLASLRQ